MLGCQEDGLKLILKKLDGCRIETSGGLLCRGSEPPCSQKMQEILSVDKLLAFEKGLYSTV